MKIATTLKRGLLGASALTILSATAAQAQFTPPPAANGTNDFTAAGTDVSNTFSLQYTTGTTTKTLPTPNTATFRVDRLINLEVVGSSRTGVLPGATAQTVQFAVTNLGNGDQGYVLDTELGNLTPYALTDPTANKIRWYVAPSDGICDEPEASGTTYVANTSVPPAGLAPNEVLCVIVSQDIDPNANDTEVANIDLIARTTEVGSTGTLDGSVANDDLTEQNVFVEGAPGPHSNDGTNDAQDSAASTYQVGAPNVDGNKTVRVLEQNATTACDAVPGGAPTIPTGNSPLYFTPGACIEYVIEVSNDGSQLASSIQIDDLLPFGVTYASSGTNGFFVGSSGGSTFTAPNVVVTGSQTCPAPNASEADCTNVALNGGAVEGTSPGDPANTAQLIIRARID